MLPVLPKFYTGCKRSEARVWGPYVNGDVLSNPVIKTDGGDEETGFHGPHQTLVIDNPVALWLPKFFFPFPVPLQHWKADLFRTGTGTHRNVQNL